MTIKKKNIYICLKFTYSIIWIWGLLLLPLFTLNLYSSSPNQSSFSEYNKLNFRYLNFFQDDNLCHKNLIQIKIKSVYYKNNFLESIKDNEHLKRFLDFLEIISIENPYSFFKDKTDNANSLQRIFEIRYANSISVTKVCKIISTSPEIEYCCPVITRHFDFFPNDSLWELQRELRTIKIDDAYDITMGDSNVIIALVDADYDWMHEDLSENVFINPGEKPGNNIDDDNNGFIDDVHGWDFLGNTSYTDFSLGKITGDNDTRIDDIDTRLAHGTFIGGCISARTNNYYGMASSAPNCKLLPVKIASDLGFSALEHKGVLYGAMMGASVINCSWSFFGFSPADREIVETVARHGVLLVNSAGNNAQNIDETSYHYENYLDVMYVGASNKDDSLANFSNYGVLTGVYAPGSEIQTCRPGNRYSVGSGSSFSAPFVSGAAGLVKSIHPDWLPRQIFHQLRSTSDRIFFEDDSPSQKLAFGRLNVEKALEYNIKFDSGKTTPGIEFTNTLINNENGFLSANDTAKIRLTIKNWLAPAKNISIEISSIDGKVSVINPFLLLDSINTLEEKQIELSIFSTNLAKWYDSEAKLIITFSSNEYINYQLLKIPLLIAPEQNAAIIPTNTNIHNKNGETGWLLIENISSTEINSVWATGIRLDGKPFFFVANSAGVITSGVITNLEEYDNRLKTKIIALGTKSAILLASHRDNAKSGLLMKTNNYGKSWQTIPLPNGLISATNFVIANSEKTVLIDDGAANAEIYISENIGKNWHKASKIDVGKGEELQKESLFASDNNIFIGTTKGKIFHSSDFGRSWDFEQFDTNFSVNLIHYHKDIGAMALLSNINKSYFAYLKNSDWIIDTNYEAFSMLTYPCFLSNTSNPTYFLAAGDKITLYNSETGKWLPCPIDSSDFNSLINSNWTAASSGLHTRVWFIADTLKYIDLGVKPEKQPDNKKNVIFFNIYPNPTADYFDIQFFLEKSQDIEVSIFNSLGQQVCNKIEYNAKAGNYETIRIDGSMFAQGIYYVRFLSGNETFLRAIALIK